MNLRLIEKNAKSHGENTRFYLDNIIVGTGGVGNNLTETIIKELK